MNKSSKASFKKRIILFIVEGRSDLVHLQYPLQKLFNSAYPGKYNIEVRHTDGDLMTKTDDMNTMNTKKVLKELNNSVRASLTQGASHFSLEDIEMIIQIADTDGAYVPDACVQSKAGQKKAFYDDIQGKIFHENRDFIVARNHKKSAILRDMIKREKLEIKPKKPAKKGENPHGIWIPYRIFYFSCNIDHYFHDNANPSDEQKRYYANDFLEETKKDPKNYFTRRIVELSQEKRWGYEESWNWLEDGTNSLKRRNNLDILVKPLYKRGINIANSAQAGSQKPQSGQPGTTDGDKFADLLENYEKSLLKS